jgi:glycosyltransferase involved in cell wall biosynthesis
VTAWQTRAGGQGCAVTLTPVAFDADSRAFRFAQLLADVGFRSVVIEGRASARHFWSEALEVRSAGKKPPPEISPGSILRPGRLRNAILAMRRGGMGAAGEAMLYWGFRAHDWWRYCQRPRFLIPPAEIYVLHSFELYRAVAPLARRLGARILYDAHDFYRGIEPPERQLAFDRKRRHPFLRGLEDRLVSAADAFTTVSNGLADLMTQTFGRRPDVIRNCHDERHDRANVPPLRKTLGLGERDRLAIVVGNYKAGLAIHVAAAALQHLPETVHLAFLGRGYESVAATLPAGLLGRRLHLGYAVAPDEIVPTIRGADLGLILYEPCSENYRHALPNGFFQLVAAGLPIVRGELPEVEAAIGNHRVGYCLPKIAPVEIAQAISRTIEELDLLRVNAEALGRSLRWENEARRLHRLIDPILVPSPSTQLQLQ